MTTPLALMPFPIARISPFLLGVFLCCRALSAPSTVEQWETLTLSFPGPESTETGTSNPFTDVSLWVEFKHEQETYQIPGFFAADGQSAESGAKGGNVWQVRFTPDRPGPWIWSAQMYAGPDAVLLPTDFPHLETHPLPIANGTFEVTPSTASDKNFRAYGRLNVDPVSGYFHFPLTNKIWIKGGADSPENLLAYRDFDGTYRHSDEFREGESRPNSSLHAYTPHIPDWNRAIPHGTKAMARVSLVRSTTSPAPA